jgi:transcription antitermination factor NusG
MSLFAMPNSSFWHVCYLKSKSEKIVKKKLEELHFEVFLPLTLHLKIYKTSKKKVLMPLFPGYIFINISPGYRHHVTALPEVYRFIKFGEVFAKVSEIEIKNLQLLVNNIKDHSEICSEITLQVGCSVMVTDGPFQGMKGKMICRNGKRRVVVEIDAIKQSISIEIETRYLKTIDEKEIVEKAYI